MTNLKATVLADARILLLFVDDLVVAGRHTLTHVEPALLHLVLIEEAIRNVHCILVELSAVSHQRLLVVGLQLQCPRSLFFHLNLINHYLLSIIAF